MYYSDHDVLELIARIEKPYESEVIELKEAKSDFSFRDLGKYFSALSNEAILRGKQDAWLIFGMNNDKVPCGTAYREGNPVNLRSLKKEIADRVNNHLTLREIHELRIDGKRVLALQIPAATPGMPTAFNNAAWAREGESLGPLPIDKYEQIRQMQRPDWSALEIEEATFEDLDPEAVKKAIELFLSKHRKARRSRTRRQQSCIGSSLSRAGIPRSPSRMPWLRRRGRRYRTRAAKVSTKRPARHLSFRCSQKQGPHHA